MKQRTKLYILPLITLSLVLTAGLAIYKTVHAADNNLTDGITVDSALDTPDANIGDGNCDDGDGNCTLRAAIEEANSDPDVSTIEFNIAPFDGSVKTITPDGATLPDITSQVIIDGFTQDDASANTSIAPNPFNAEMRIELNGENTPDSVASAGLLFNTGSDDSIVRGLVINRFYGSGIGINPEVDGIVIRGNYVGTDPTGLIARPNERTAVNVYSLDIDSGGPTNGIIGGNQPADRNILSGNNCNCADPGRFPQGISLSGGANDWVIKGNYIGIAADGVTAMGNQAGGITVDYVDRLIIGGTETGASNIFSGNEDGGIQPDAVTDLVIQGNFIGTDYTGTVPVPNAYKGISVAYGSSNILIGGTQPGAGNVIANAGNGHSGVYTTSTMDGHPDTDNITIIGNSIFDNEAYGIDINLDGLSPNDPLDADTGSNDLLNFPDNITFYEESGDTHLDYTLDVPAGDYRIEFFSNDTADPSGYGEGKTFLGYQNVTSAGTGSQSFSTSFSGTSIPNISSTTTEIDDSSDGFGSTSEFSAIAIPPPPPPDFIDLSLSKTLTDPENVTPGGTIHYNLSLTNIGYTPADLSILDGGGGGNPFQSVFVDFLPPELTFVSSSNPDITCTDVGTIIPGLIAVNHSDWHAVVCLYTGSGEMLDENETFSTIFEVTVANDSDLVFTNYALGGSYIAEDPDATAMGTSINDSFIGGGTPDFIDSMLDLAPNNFASATFPIPVEQETSGGSSNSSNNQGLLGSTGKSVLISALVALGLIISSAILYKNRKRSTGSGSV